MDGVIIEHFERDLTANLKGLQDELVQQTYAPLPLLKILVDKGNNEPGPSGDRLIVQKDEEILLEVQCHKIDAVLIFGNVQFTTQAVHELFQHGIEMVILTRRGKLITLYQYPNL